MCLHPCLMKGFKKKKEKKKERIKCHCCAHESSILVV